MTSAILWLSGTAVAVTIWISRRRWMATDDLGTVSAQWLHAYRHDTHQSD